MLSAELLSLIDPELGGSERKTPFFFSYRYCGSMIPMITIYTDGAARGNPGPAGWGVVIFVDNTIIELGGRADHSTNNIMELTAPIRAMEYVKNNLSNAKQIEIFSDSKYVITGINEWVHNWIKNGWRTANKKPVLNQELWEQLYQLNQELKPTWKYVRGHSGDRWNDRVDEIATSFADNTLINLCNGLLNK